MVPCAGCPGRRFPAGRAMREPAMCCHQAAPYAQLLHVLGWCAPPARDPCSWRLRGASRTHMCRASSLGRRKYCRQAGSGCCCCGCQCLCATAQQCSLALSGSSTQRKGPVPAPAPCTSQVWSHYPPRSTSASSRLQVEENMGALAVVPKLTPDMMSRIETIVAVPGKSGP